MQRLKSIDMLFPFKYTFPEGSDISNEFLHKGINAKRIHPFLFAEKGKCPQCEYYIDMNMNVYSVKHISGVIGITECKSVRESNGKCYLCIGKTYIERAKAMYISFVSGNYVKDEIEHIDGDLFNDKPQNLEVKNKESPMALDNISFLEVYESEFKNMEHYAAFVCGSNLYSNDIVQEAFIKMVYKGTNATYIKQSWMKYIYNSSLNYKSILQRNMPYEDNYAIDDRLFDFPLVRLINKKYKVPIKVIEMVLQGYSRVEISKLLGKSKAAVNSAVDVAVKELRKNSLELN